MDEQPPSRFSKARAAVLTVRVWRETYDPPGVMKTDWAWFDDAHEESHDEYHIADRGEILGTVGAWIDRFLEHPEAVDPLDAQGPFPTPGIRHTPD